MPDQWWYVQHLPLPEESVVPLKPGQHREPAQVKAVQSPGPPYWCLPAWGRVWVELVFLLWVEDGNILGAHHLAQEVVLLVCVGRADCPPWSNPDIDIRLLVLLPRVAIARGDDVPP
jgi:hypothetical protein